MYIILKVYIDVDVIACVDVIVGVIAVITLSKKFLEIVIIFKHIVMTVEIHFILHVVNAIYIKSHIFDQV